MQRRNLAPVVKQLAAGFSVEEIAQSFAITRQALYQQLKSAGLPTTCLTAVRLLRAEVSPGAGIDAAHKKQP